MIITLTLQSGYTGNTNIGPFTVSGTTLNGSDNTVNMTTGSITRSQLISGWNYNDTTDTITGGTIASTGDTCKNSIHWRTYPAGYYYTVQQLEPHCSGNIGSCGGPLGSPKIAYSTVSIDITKYYNSLGDVYGIINTTLPQASDMDISSWANSGYVNCGDAVNC
jgi:hypothetical protein